MTARVIQGFFSGGRPRVPAPMDPRKSMAHQPGPRAPDAAARPQVVQARGTADSFPVDAGRLGLVSGGGQPLPPEVRGRMEAAFGTSFSNVRTHVGPQAERIGAVAFTIGADIYFAPGRYEPGTVQGQQLLGHELAHVVQQRQGRVRNPMGTGVAVVQDQLLEAEADRMGLRASAHPVTVQAKPAAQARLAATGTAVIQLKKACLVCGHKHGAATCTVVIREGNVNRACGCQSHSSKFDSGAKFNPGSGKRQRMIDNMKG